MTAPVRGKISVSSVTVDELTRRYGIPDVLFVDVEGFESNVMRGSDRHALAPSPGLLFRNACRVRTRKNLAVRSNP